LLDAQIDNAVIDAMLERAERGERVGHAVYLLPWVRLVKGYSAVLNVFGAIGPVPEGMSATVALRVRWLSREHARLKRRVVASVAEHRARRGYAPPYWTLLAMSRDAAR
jgi:hypothetical protein